MPKAVGSPPTQASAPSPHNRGVALVSILLLVAIVTALATSMLSEQKASIASARSFIERSQAEQYALGGEELARQLLHQDLADGDGRDHLAEPWASKELRFEYEEGEVRLTITDLQGRLNVNALAESRPDAAKLSQWLANLLQATGADPNLIAQLQDWLDLDSNARLGGAEDYDYLGQGRPYRTGSGPIADVSELRLLLDMSAEAYQRLSPHLSALPDPAAPLNINTAPPEVLQSLASSMTLDSAQALAARRDREEGFKSVAAFLQAPEVAGSGLVAQGLAIGSAYFEARVVARYRDRYSYLASVIQRSAQDGSLRVLSRNFARPLLPPKEAENG